ncbi:MAG: hypothetical protein H0W77_05980 [Acidobacteria bacterium]|nr:hypothetical protein [Acidobacteriota bacterium]
MQQAHSPQQILKARVGTQRVEAQNHRPHIATILPTFPRSNTTPVPHFKNRPSPCIPLMLAVFNTDAPA